MNTFEVNNLKDDILNSIKPSYLKNHDSLKIFWFYFFLMRNRKLEKNHIGEIKDFLLNCDIPREQWQFLDEDITSFLLGYRILTEINENKKFIDKANLVKKELEKHWNSKNKLYFDSEFLTLLILASYMDNPHSKDILAKFKDTKNCKLLLIYFIILENDDNTLKETYIPFVNKIEKKYYLIPNSEVIYVAWILWNYRKLSKSKIPFIKDTITNYFSTTNWIMEEIKKGSLDYKISVYYDIMSDFNKNTRIALEEVPFTYRLLGFISGCLSIFIVLYMDIIMWNAGLLHPNLNDKILNYLIIAFSGFFIFLGLFSIHQIGIKGIYSDIIIKNKLMDLIKWILLSFIVGGIGFSAIISLLS